MPDLSPRDKGKLLSKHCACIYARAGATMRRGRWPRPSQGCCTVKQNPHVQAPACRWPRRWRGCRARATASGARPRWRWAVRAWAPRRASSASSPTASKRRAFRLEVITPKPCFGPVVRKRGLRMLPAICLVAEFIKGACAQGWCAARACVVLVRCAGHSASVQLC